MTSKFLTPFDVFPLSRRKPAYKNKLRLTEERSADLSGLHDLRGLIFFPSNSLSSTNCSSLLFVMGARFTASKHTRHENQNLSIYQNPGKSSSSQNMSFSDQMISDDSDMQFYTTLQEAKIIRKVYST